MPEGDTVYLAAKRMAAALSGKRLIRGVLRHPRIAEHDLSGLTVLGVHSVGKHMFCRFGGGRSLHTHFRMDGSWHLYRPEQRWQRPSHQARAVLTTQERVAIDPDTVVTLARRLLLANADRPEQSTTGELARGKQHWVYERDGKPCRRCRERVIRTVQGQGTYARNTYYCPRCQPDPHPSP